MAHTAYLPLICDRYGTLVRHVYLVGLDLAGVDMRAQVRLYGDVPGAPLIDLRTVTNGNAEGLRLVEVVTDAQGLKTSHVEIVINETTMESLPYAGEIGDATQLAWDWQITISGRKRRLARGEFEITGDGVTGAEVAPTGRQHGIGRPRLPVRDVWTSAKLTFGEEQVTVQIDGADLLAPEVKRAADAADAARGSQGAAELAAATALASGRYFTSRAAGEAGSATNQLFSTDDAAGSLIYYRRTAAGSTEIGRAVTPAALASNTGFTLIKHKRAETGTKARSAAQLSKIGGFESGDGTVSVHHWIDPDLDDLIVKRENGVDLTPMIQAALDYAPIASTLGFLSGDYRLRSGLVQRRYLHLSGAFTSRLQAVFLNAGGQPDLHPDVYRVELDAGPYGVGGDARKMRFSGMDFYAAVGGRTAFFMEAVQGATPNLFAEFERCIFAGNGGYAAHIRGLVTQGHGFTNCEFTNTLFLDGCADGVNVERSQFGGTKVGIIARLAAGAFKTRIANCLIVCRDGALWVRDGSQIDFFDNQCEQIGVNASDTPRCHVFISPENYVSKLIRLRGSNFGGGSNIDYGIVAQGNGAAHLDGLFIDENTFGITATGIDIALNNDECRWTRIGPGNEARGNRDGVVIDGFGQAAPNDRDPATLLNVIDNARGTYGRWKGAVLASPWTADGGRAPVFHKSLDNTLTLRGVASGGSAGSTVLTLPVGYRPVYETRVPAVCGSGMGVLRFETGGAVVAEAIPGGSIDLHAALPVKGRVGYDPGY